MADNNDPIMDKDKNGFNEMFNYQSKFIELTRQLDSLRSDYVQLNDTVKDCVIRTSYGLFKLKPEVQKLISGQQNLELHEICRSNHLASDVLNDLINKKFINLDKTEESTG